MVLNDINRMSIALFFMAVCFNLLMVIGNSRENNSSDILRDSLLPPKLSEMNNVEVDNPNDEDNREIPNFYGSCDVNIKKIIWRFIFGFCLICFSSLD